MNKQVIEIKRGDEKEDLSFIATLTKRKGKNKLTKYHDEKIKKANKITLSYRIYYKNIETLKFLIYQQKIKNEQDH